MEQDADQEGTVHPQAATGHVGLIVKMFGGKKTFSRVWTL